MSASDAGSVTPDCHHTYALLSRAAEPRLLLLPGEGGWSLPAVVSPKRFGTRVEALREAFLEQFGLEVIVLRRVEGREGCSVYSLEVHASSSPLDAGRWIGRDELQELPLTLPEQRSLLEAWFAEAESGEVPALRPEWARPGWFAEASVWMQERLTELGLEPIGPVEQFRTLSISCLLGAPTREGAFYLKAVPPLFRSEPALTRALAERYPGHVPDVVAIDARRRWMLMREFAGQQLHAVTDAGAWEETARLVARIQIDMAERAEWLLSQGCPDRRLDRLAAQIDPLLADTGSLTPASGGALSAEEIERVRALAPRLREWCAELAGGPVPPSLVHGDLHPGNIVVTDRGALIYDWTDGCLSHPFLDLVTLIPQQQQPDSVIDRDRLRSAYLEGWMRYAPMGKLTPLFEQAQLLGAVHQAVSYQMITASIEAKEEMAGGVPGWLRRLLREPDSPPAS
jgi:aminoglycoside phosphotransferase (APT) family kinase protein